MKRPDAATRLRRSWAAPPVAWVLLAHVAPLLATVRVSLLDAYPGPPGAAAAWSLGAYRAFAAGPGYGLALLRSLALAGAATAVSLLVAFPLACHVALQVPPDRRMRRLLLIAAPFWAGEVVRVSALAALLGRNGPVDAPVNALLRSAGFGTAPLLYGPGSVLLGTVYTVLLSMFLPLYAALERLPRDLLDAAADLGAGPWRQVREVVLPLTARGAAAGCALCFLSSLGLLAAPALLGGPGAPVFASVVAAMFGGASGRWPQGAAFGLILLATGLVAAGLLRAAPASSPKVHQ